jgi:hypothetical protein
VINLLYSCTISFVSLTSYDFLFIDIGALVLMVILNYPLRACSRLMRDLRTRLKHEARVVHS